MKHNHSCTCAHENVEFCRVCRVVHCLSCNQEWSPRVNYNQYYNTPIWSGAFQGSLVQQSQQSNLTAASNLPTCSHKDL